MKDTVCIETTERYELNKMYADIECFKGVFACTGIEEREHDSLVTFEVVWE
ncbi:MULTISPECIES: hypothetical protein [Listeria]|uniref:hypothetical protein n=1 Tax=Listeria TaxID=1637 RepID=UPI000A9BCE3C|nr:MULTISPECIES: hypothetical protein [Listeria]MBC1752552.1 hypothetical protein [Listeria seeligeri]